MAAGDFRPGAEAKFYYGAAGSQANTLTTNVVDVKQPGGTRVASANVRGKPFPVRKPVGLDGTLTFTMYEIVGDGLMTAILSAYQNKTKIALWARSASDGPGWDADWYVEQCEPGQDEDGFCLFSVVAAPCEEQRLAVWQ